MLGNKWDGQAEKPLPSQVEETVLCAGSPGATWLWCCGCSQLLGEASLVVLWVSRGQSCLARAESLEVNMAVHASARPMVSCSWGLLLRQSCCGGFGIFSVTYGVFSR